MKYIPAPWEITEPLPSYEKGKMVGVIDNIEKVIFNLRDLKGKEKKGNAQRILDCVNACEGMENPKEEIERLKELAWRYEELG